MVFPAPERPASNQTLVKRKEVTAIKSLRYSLDKEITETGKQIEVLPTIQMHAKSPAKMSWDFSTLISAIKSIRCIQSKRKFDVKGNSQTVPHQVINQVILT